MPTLSLRNGAVAYTDTGPPPGIRDAATIVFGHGLLFGGWMFRHQIAALQDSYRCVTLDWRGQGLSPFTGRDMDIDSLTSDAVEVIDTLDVGPVHWVGLSMGGFVGLRLAARHSDALRTLTLLDSSAEAEDPAQARKLVTLALAVRLVGPRPFLKESERLLFGPDFRADPANKPVLDEWRRRILRCRRSATSRAVLSVARRPSVEHEIHRIRVPTLAVCGNQDLPTPIAKSCRIAESIKGARLALIPQCGHTSSLEQPDAITERIVDFLSAHPRS